MGGSGVSIGYIVQFAGNFVIRGTEAANGFEASIAANTALFSILGTTYGGNGKTTFSLPDLGGNLAAGVGSGPGLAERWLGERFGGDDLTRTIPNLPASFGGSSAPMNNAETTLTTNFVINVYGVYPSPDSGSPRLDSIGMVHQFAGNFEPNGAMFCDGRLRCPQAPGVADFHSRTCSPHSV